MVSLPATCAIFVLTSRGWSSRRTSPEEREPVEVLLRRKAETDRVREGISEGFRFAEPERVVPRGARALEPQPRPPSPCPSLFPYVRIIPAIRLTAIYPLRPIKETPYAIQDRHPRHCQSDESR